MCDTSYDLFVIGGGSGGIACARRAAAWGAKVAIAENVRWGGTCVNVGCVPKKIMWNASHVAETLRECRHYGFSVGDVKFSWEEIKRRRDAVITRLNGIYETNLKNAGIDHMLATAAFADGQPGRVVVGDKTVEARHVLIAVGGEPKPLGVPGEAEHTITSDGFFELEALPKKVCVVGAGYIAVELAGVFHGLGVDTHLFVRGDTALRAYDPLIKSELHREMTAAGIKVHPKSFPEKFEKVADGTVTMTYSGGQQAAGFDCVLVAIGRRPKLVSTKLSSVGVKLNKDGYVVTDEFENTSVPNVYALGDINGKIELTPMAIAAGRRLADRLFGGMPEAKASYELAASVVFSHPPIGVIGLTEPQAREKFGDDVKVYVNTGGNLYYNVFDVPPAEKPKTSIKMICLKSLNEKIVGFHLIGMGADEMLQGFAVAIKMGATKADFDSSLAIHPTAAEEAVTLAPWGLSEPPAPPAARKNLR